MEFANYHRQCEQLGTVLSNVGVCPSFDCHSTRWCLGRGWLSTPDNQSIRWCSERGCGELLTATCVFAV